ncbi:MAG: signal peptidase II [Persephonella sp.]|nr:MAG: signal peptidase II [Persephonella sp.]
MKKRFLKFWVVAFLIFILDLITKEFAEKYLANKVIPIIPNFFNLVLVWNKGMAFGLLGNAPEILRFLTLIIATFIIIVITILYAYKNTDNLPKLQFYSLALITGGALGNLYDRLFIGKVRDFLDFYIGNYHWPAFNIADSSITVGVIIFVSYEIFFKRKEEWFN